MGFFGNIRNKLNDSLENFDVDKSINKASKILNASTSKPSKPYFPLFSGDWITNDENKDNVPELNDEDNLETNDHYDWKEDSSHPVHKK
jgi:hypothetical protein